MGRFTKIECRSKKLPKPTDREITSALILLRCKQLGLTLEDLDVLDLGAVMDMAVEQANDDYEYPVLATQEDMDNF